MSEVEVTNDPEVERLGADAAATYASEFWVKIVTAARLDIRCLDATWDNFTSCDDEDLDIYNPDTDTSKTKISNLATSKVILTHSPKLDKQLYTRFRATIGGLSVSRVGTNGTLSLNTPQWQSLLIASNGIVPDFSFITLLREDVNTMFYMDTSRACDGLCVVSRAQFLYVEVARCREGGYGRGFRRRLEVFDLTTFADKLRSLTSSKNVDLELTKLTSLINEVQKIYPLPHKSAITTSKIGRYIKLAASHGCTAAANLMDQWRNGLELCIIARSPVDRVAEAGRFSVQCLIDNSDASFQSFQSPQARLGLIGQTAINEVDESGEQTFTHLDVSNQSLKSTASTFANNGIIYHSTPIFTPSELTSLRIMSKNALNSLISDHLEPRNLAFEDEFDFAEVRHRPGNRLDNRYCVDPTIVLNNKQIMETVKSIFGSSDAGKCTLLYSGVVHAWQQAVGDGDADADEVEVHVPQVWHRDGPSLFDSTFNGDQRGTHCLNVFIPLCDVHEANGSTEFIPTTHLDTQFNALSPAIIKAAEADEYTLAPGVAKPEISAGGFAMFDIRTMHRGGANRSDEQRDVLYLTFAFDFWVDAHMFNSPALVRPVTDEWNEGVVEGLLELIVGAGAGAGVNLSGSEGEGEKEEQEQKQEEDGHAVIKKPNLNFPNHPADHPHYTTAFHSLILEDLNDTDIKLNARGMQNTTAVLKYTTYNQTQRSHYTAKFIKALSSEKANALKTAALTANKKKLADKRKVAADFTSMDEDYNDVQCLYNLANELAQDVMHEFGFSSDVDGQGFLVLLALLKCNCVGVINRLGGIHRLVDEIESEKKTMARLEECMTGYWHASESGRFMWNPNNNNNNNIDADADADADAQLNGTLLLVFSSLGSGMVRPEWEATLKQCGVFDDASKFKVLHVLDPSYTWYNQDPTCSWNGGEYYEARIRDVIVSGGFSSVVFLGDSMGGAGALRFSHLADFTLAFTPQIDLKGYKAVKRLDFSDDMKNKFKNAIVTNVQEVACNTNDADADADADVEKKKEKKYIEIHYGIDCIDDVKQIACLDVKIARKGDRVRRSNVHVVGHDFNDHTLSIELKRRNELVDVLTSFLNKTQNIPDLSDHNVEEEEEEIVWPTLPQHVKTKYEKWYYGIITEVTKTSGFMQKSGHALTYYDKDGKSYWEDYPPEDAETFVLIRKEEYELGTGVKSEFRRPFL